MTDTVLESATWPVNNLGEILVQSGTGGDDRVGALPSAFIPQDFASSKVPLKFPSDIVTDGVMPGRVVAKMDGSDGVLAAVSANPGEAVSIDSTSFAVPMIKCVMSTTPSSVFQADYTLTNPVFIGGFTSLQMSLAFASGSSVDTNGAIQVWLYTTGSTYLVRPQLSTTYQEPGRLFVASFGRDCFVSGDPTNRLDEDQIIKIRITITGGTAPSSDSVVWVGPVVCNQRRKKGSILLWADGNYISQNSYLLPMLDNYGLKCNLAILPRTVVPGNGAVTTSMNEAMLRAAYANGHRICIHTAGQATNGWDNVADYPNGSDNGYTSVLNELIAGDAYLDSMGWPEGKGHRVSAYTNPFQPTVSNARQKAVAAAFTTAGLKTCRQGGTYLANASSSVGMLHPAVPNANWRKMVGTMQLTNTNSAFEPMQMIDTAAQRGEVGGILLHRAVTNSTVPASLEMTLANTQLWVEYLAAMVASGAVINETVDVCYKRLKGA